VENLLPLSNENESPASPSVKGNAKKKKKKEKEDDIKTLIKQATMEGAVNGK